MDFTVKSILVSYSSTILNGQLCTALASVHHHSLRFSDYIFFFIIHHFGNVNAATAQWRVLYAIKVSPNDFLSRSNTITCPLIETSATKNCNRKRSTTTASYSFSLIIRKRRHTVVDVF